LLHLYSAIVWPSSQRLSNNTMVSVVSRMIERHGFSQLVLRDESLLG
jgi:hypothetical protein